MEKIDFKKKLKALYQPSATRVVEVEVLPLDFLMIDGEGDPNASQAYREAVEALFSVSYRAKFALKKDRGIDYGVMPLEGLWWSDDMSAFVRRDKAKWKWTLMIMQPSLVTPALVDTVVRDLHGRKALPGLAGLRFERFDEGRCAQTLHIGPFSEEGPTIRRVHDFIHERSALRGRHHEIYLSDIRKAAPERWRTIVQQPMA